MRAEKCLHPLCDRRFSCLLAESRDLFERWPALTQEEERGIVEAIVEGIQIGKEEVAIDLSCFRGSSEVAGKGQRNAK